MGLQSQRWLSNWTATRQLTTSKRLFLSLNDHYMLVLLFVLKGNKNSISKKCMHSHVCWCIPHNWHHRKTTWVLTNAWKNKKKGLTHIHNGILFGHKKGGYPVIGDNMDGLLEHLSEISQTEKYKHWMISHMHPIWKCQFFSSCSSIQSISKELEHIFDLSCQWKQVFI